MSIWTDIQKRSSGEEIRKEDVIMSSIKIEDKYSLLSSEETRLLHQSLLRDFSLGRYKSLEDILVAPNPLVSIIIDPREPKYGEVKGIPFEFEEAKAFWEEKIRENPNDEHARRMLGEIKDEIGKWKSQLIRGLYDPGRKIIMLFPNNMKKEYGGTRMKELLVSTLVHETMHAYFDRVPLNDLPYIYSLEEPMAEFGMLLYLKETNQTSDFITWAKGDVGSKRSCYRYGVALMEQCEREGQPSQTRRDLELYKAIWPTFSLIMKPSMSTISKKGGKSKPKRYSVYDKKGRLIEGTNAINGIPLIVVRDYCNTHTGIAFSTLDSIFNKVTGYNLPSQYKGMIIPEKDVNAYTTSLKAKGKAIDTRVHNDSITLASGDVIFVTDQWTATGDKATFSDFVLIAKKLGYLIFESKPL